MIYLMKNDPNAVVEQCQRMIELDPNMSRDMIFSVGPTSKKGATRRRLPSARRSPSSRRDRVPSLVDWATFTRCRATALRLLLSLSELEKKYDRREVIGQHLAAIYYALGDKDQAFAWLEKDFKEHSAELQHIMERVQFEQIRHEPRRLDLLRRMGLNL